MYSIIAILCTAAGAQAGMGCCDDPLFRNPENNYKLCTDNHWGLCKTAPNAEEVQMMCPKTCAKAIGDTAITQQYCQEWCDVEVPEKPTNCVDNPNYTYQGGQCTSINYYCDLPVNQLNCPWACMSRGSNPWNEISAGSCYDYIPTTTTTTTTIPTTTTTTTIPTTTTTTTPTTTTTTTTTTTPPNTTTTTPPTTTTTTGPRSFTCEGPTIFSELYNGVDALISTFNATGGPFASQYFIANATTPNGMGAIGMDAYTRFLYTMVYNPSNDPLTARLGRIGKYPAEEAYFIEYFPVEPTVDGLDFSILGGDVFSPGGNAATEPGYFVTTDGYGKMTYVKIANNLGVEHMEMIRLTQLGPETRTAGDIAFHPESTDPNNAVYFTVQSDQDDLILLKHVINFSTNEVTGVDLGPIYINGSAFGAGDFVNAVYFDDQNRLYFMRRESQPDAEVYHITVPFNANYQEGWQATHADQVPTDGNGDGARCIGFYDATTTTTTTTTPPITTTTTTL